MSQVSIVQVVKCLEACLDREDVKLLCASLSESCKLPRTCTKVLEVVEYLISHLKISLGGNTPINLIVLERALLEISTEASEKLMDLHLTQLERAIASTLSLERVWMPIFGLKLNCRFKLPSVPGRADIRLWVSQMSSNEDERRYFGRQLKDACSRANLPANQNLINAVDSIFNSKGAEDFFFWNEPACEVEMDIASRIALVFVKPENAKQCSLICQLANLTPPEAFTFMGVSIWLKDWRGQGNLFQRFGSNLLRQYNNSKQHPHAKNLRIEALYEDLARIDGGLKFFGLEPVPESNKKKDLLEEITSVLLDRSNFAQLQNICGLLKLNRPTGFNSIEIEKWLVQIRDYGNDRFELGERISRDYKLSKTVIRYRNSDLEKLFEQLIDANAEEFFGLKIYSSTPNPNAPQIKEEEDPMEIVLQPTTQPPYTWVDRLSEMASKDIFFAGNDRAGREKALLQVLSDQKVNDALRQKLPWFMGEKSTLDQIVQKRSLSWSRLVAALYDYAEYTLLHRPVRAFPRLDITKSLKEAIASAKEADLMELLVFDPSIDLESAKAIWRTKAQEYFTQSHLKKWNQVTPGSYWSQRELTPEMAESFYNSTMVKAHDYTYEGELVKEEILKIAVEKKFEPCVAGKLDTLMETLFESQQPLPEKLVLSDPVSTGWSAAEFLKSLGISNLQLAQNLALLESEPDALKVLPSDQVPEYIRGFGATHPEVLKIVIALKKQGFLQ